MRGQIVGRWGGLGGKERKIEDWRKEEGMRGWGDEEREEENGGLEEEKNGRRGEYSMIYKIVYV